VAGRVEPHLVGGQARRQVREAVLVVPRLSRLQRIRQLVLVEEDDGGQRGERGRRKGPPVGQAQEVARQDQVEPLAPDQRLGLAGQVDGRPAHPPLPLPGRHGEQRPTVTAHGPKTGQEIGVGTAEIRLQGQDVEPFGHNSLRRRRAVAAPAWAGRPRHPPAAHARSDRGGAGPAGRVHPTRRPGRVNRPAVRGPGGFGADTGTQGPRRKPRGRRPKSGRRTLPRFGAPRGLVSGGGKPPPLPVFLLRLLLGGLLLFLRLRRSLASTRTAHGAPPEGSAGAPPAARIVRPPRRRGKGTLDSRAASAYHGRSRESAPAPTPEGPEGP